MCGEISLDILATRIALLLNWMCRCIVLQQFREMKK